MKLTINTDGGARGNPGPAAWAFVVKEDGKVVHEASGFMGTSTNNQAEYMGVLKAMEWLEGNKTLLEAGPVPRFSQIHPQGDPGFGSPSARATRFDEILFILDSELVARQLSGQYKIKDEKLKGLAVLVKEKERKLKSSVSYTSVRREQNKEADALVNKELDAN